MTISFNIFLSRKSFPTDLAYTKITSPPKMRLNVDEFKVLQITVKNVATKPYALEIHDIFELVHLNGVKTVFVCPRVIKNGIYKSLIIDTLFEHHIWYIFQ